MPIIGKVGRKSFKVRFLNTSIHLVLLIGAITMIYPFMIMVSSSFKSNVDSQKFSIYPQYFFDDEMLFRKFVESRLNEESSLLNEQYKNRYFAFEFLEFPENPVEQKFLDWQEFLTETSRQHDVFDFYTSELTGRGVYPRNERTFRNLMKSENKKDLELFNQKYETSFLSWEEVRMEERDILTRKFTGNYHGFLKRYQDFKNKLPLWNRVYTTLDGNYINNELKPLSRGDIGLLNEKLGTNYASWDNVVLDETIPEGSLRANWINYLKQQLNIQHIGVQPEANKIYQDFLADKYSELQLLNKTYKTAYYTFSEISIPESLPRSGAMLVDFAFFIENIVPAEFLYVKSVELEFRAWLANKYVNISQLNDAYQNGYHNFTDIPLTSGQPERNLKWQKDWLEFVKNSIELSSMQLSMTSQQEFREYLKEKFPTSNNEIDVEKVNLNFGTDFRKAINIYPTPTIPEDATYREAWLDFYRNHTSGQFLKLEIKPEQENWVRFLSAKYGNIEALNEEYNLIFNNFKTITPDYQTFDYYTFKAHKNTIFWEFTKRNYVMVLDEMLYNGRAIINTLIYCFLAILTAILINPLAAYAMSRFKLRATYKIILILMLTMAFPPMVMGIPNFLILKKLNMLNTFWALILPAAADGYFIFLLKGFFDSLPKELFESATIDGASERRIFWQIAMQLSKPIMAVIALGAFNAAYRNFMFAFIVCQDSSMWTMMVHIYQLMQRSSSGVGFAALVIAAIPTFAVFVFFQNIIIKGIVVPTEK